jgi:hypothetical protein
LYRHLKVQEINMRELSKLNCFSLREESKAGAMSPQGRARRGRAKFLSQQKFMCDRFL